MKILEEKHLVSDLNRRVFVDALTSVRNRGAFANYIADLQERLDRKEQIEFAVILQNEDFRNRDELVQQFEKTRQELCATAKNRWEEPHVAMGMAVYAPELDGTVDDTIHRADKIMYENKRMGKLRA